MTVELARKSRRVAICGAGGHGRVVADIVERDFSDREIHGYFDDRADLLGAVVSGHVVLGRIDQSLETDPEDYDLIIAIGTNEVRAKISSRLHGSGRSFATAIHPSAQIGTDVEIGPGTVVMANAVVNTGARIGAHVIINTSSSVDHDCVIDDYVHIAPGAHLGGDVRVGRGTQISIGACVIPGVSIGEWSVIGAGATVIRDMPEAVIAVGTPAIVLRKREALA